jgi:predicted  nucleic acid-binding Zn-ribbon protein
MPHRCVKCGKEYKEASFAVLKGCEQCGGKKFLFIRVQPDSRGSKPPEKVEHGGRDVPASPDPGDRHPEPEKSGLNTPVERGDRVESVRIIAPGTYELNIAKMAESDERVVATGSDGSYMVDLISMMKPGRKKKAEK